MFQIPQMFLPKIFQIPQMFGQTEEKYTEEKYTDEPNTSRPSLGSYGIADHRGDEHPKA